MIKIMKKEKKTDVKTVEDITLYGEEVPSLNQWMTLDKQRKKARKHEALSKKK
jgi:hypothetical protein